MVLFMYKLQFKRKEVKLPLDDSNAKVEGARRTFKSKWNQLVVLDKGGCD